MDRVILAQAVLQSAQERKDDQIFNINTERVREIYASHAYNFEAKSLTPLEADREILDQFGDAKSVEDVEKITKNIVEAYASSLRAGLGESAEQVDVEQSKVFQQLNEPVNLDENDAQTAELVTLADKQEDQILDKIEQAAEREQVQEEVEAGDVDVEDKPEKPELGVEIEKQVQQEIKETEESQPPPEPSAASEAMEVIEEQNEPIQTEVPAAPEAQAEEDIVEFQDALEETPEEQKPQESEQTESPEQAENTDNANASETDSNEKLDAKSEAEEQEEQFNEAQEKEEETVAEAEDEVAEPEEKTSPAEEPQDEEADPPASEDAEKPPEDYTESRKRKLDDRRESTLKRRRTSRRKRMPASAVSWLQKFAAADFPLENPKVILNHVTPAEIVQEVEEDLGGPDLALALLKVYADCSMANSERPDIPPLSETEKWIKQNKLMN